MTTNDSVERILDQINKDYGDGIITSGDDAVSQSPTVIRWSPCLDIITGGGVEEGGWVGITGEPKFGKTTAALTLAAEAQQPEYAVPDKDGNLRRRPVFYSKIEGRLSTTHLKAIRRLDRSKGMFNIIGSREGRILSAEEHLTILENVIKTVPGAVIIIDSISCLCDQNEMTSEVGKPSRRGGALFSQFLRNTNQTVPVNRSIVIGITHLICNTSGYGAHKVERTARAWLYQKNYDIEAKKKEVWTAGETNIGLKIEWHCKTTPTGNPYLKSNGYLRFGVGIDRLFEAIQVGCDAKLITKGGSWFTLDYLGDKPPKYQGAEAVYKALLDNPEWATSLDKRISELFGATVEG